MSADAAASASQSGRGARGRRLSRILRATALLIAGALVVAIATSWISSQRAPVYSAMAMGVADIGNGATVVGGDGHAHDPAAGPDGGSVSVSELIEDPHRSDDVHVELTARAESIVLAGGERVDAFTLNGTTPGPEIRAAQGELIEVVLRNEDVAGGVTLHWHGVDVPAAMDGVAGVTQDAVRPSEAFTYRFVAEDAGSYWYHSHQLSHAQVLGGLFGALVIEPADGLVVDDVAALLHTYPGTSRTLTGMSGEVAHDAAVGSTARVRLINTDNAATAAWVSGASFLVVAVDGTELREPTPVHAAKLLLTAGGRIDLEVVVPATGAVRVQAPGVSIVLGPSDTAPPSQPAPDRFLDLLDYGSPAPPAFDPAQPDRSFTYDIGRAPGFLDGTPGIWWTINGRMGDDVPMYMVQEGDVVRMRISNASGEAHPMHLHGHHLLVLARDGVLASGSPWWVDSLHVEHGESYDVAFVADNPGIWMDHCHNLPHASEGLMTHLSYEGVTTPFLLGRDSGNEPE